jgi:hypothetical protein
MSPGSSGFFVFHKRGEVWRHPNELGTAEIEQFLSHLATDRHVSASTQNQAFGAILFLYRAVLEIPLERIDALRARRTRRVGACRSSLTSSARWRTTC